MHIAKTVKDIVNYSADSKQSIEYKEIQTEFSSYWRNTLVFVVGYKQLRIYGRFKTIINKDTFCQ